MKKLLFIALLAISSIAKAQELRWHEAWSVTASTGAYISSPAVFGGDNTLSFTNLHRTTNLQVSKHITSVFALALDYQYTYRRHIIAPMLRTDMLTFYRPDSYRSSPHALTADLGIGLGHYDAPDPSPTDHNYLVYLARLSYDYDITNRISLVASAGFNARTYSHMVGFSVHRTDFYFRVGITFRISDFSVSPPQGVKYVFLSR